MFSGKHSRGKRIPVAHPLPALKRGAAKGDPNNKYLFSCRAPNAKRDSLRVTVSQPFGNMLCVRSHFDNLSATFCATNCREFEQMIAQKVTNNLLKGNLLHVGAVLKVTFCRAFPSRQKVTFTLKETFCRAFPFCTYFIVLLVSRCFACFPSFVVLWFVLFVRVARSPFAASPVPARLPQKVTPADSRLLQHGIA